MNFKDFIRLKNCFLLLLTFAVLLSGCESSNSPAQRSVKVNNESELNKALEESKPGDVIVLANGVWNDVQIKFRGTGTETEPITIKSQTPGQVTIEGQSYLKFGGQFLVADGLHFKNGYTPSKAVVDFKINDKEIASNCKLINSVIEDFNQQYRDTTDLWVQFWGRNNELSHCYLAGKTNRGPTVRVNLEGIESINNHHKIINNHFGPRPPKGGPSAETIQIGNSYTSMSPSYTLVANNLFDECNGEVEVISSKTNFNEFRNNVFYKSEGSLVTRHGNYCTIDGNYFIGDGVNQNIGGIRIINTGHWVTNNYFFNLIGESFRSPLAVMNGIPKSPQNRYNQVTDVVVAYNTYINCKTPWQFGVGSNIEQADVLPASEIRSARAERTTVANNVIYNEKGQQYIVFEHDKADGVLFKSNVVNNQGVAFNNYNEGIIEAPLDLKQISDYIFIPTNFPEDVEPFLGFDFDNIKTDLLGNSRETQNQIGAVVGPNIEAPNILDKSKYGPKWFNADGENTKSETYEVAKSEDFQPTIDKAKSGDIIVLKPGDYEVNTSLKINKSITIKASENTQVNLVFTGDTASPLFLMQPKGKLNLQGVSLQGNKSNYAFASLKERMSNHFGLSVSNCKISNFDFVLKVYKQAFAEHITFQGTSISDCNNGLELSEETNDKGDYNTEYLTINECEFNNVKANVVDYYRGGYDESTIGGNLNVTNSLFTNCGSEEPNNVLLNHRGIVNVNISNNTFKNNPVAYVAVLWGAKNNSHANNTISNSGEIKVQQNLEMTLMY